MIRLQMFIPIMAFTSYRLINNQTSFINKYVLETFKEIYEAFVIYIFFSMLIKTLGCEKDVIIGANGKKLIKHFFVLDFFFKKIDISSSPMYLYIKRGVVQYIWFKPFFCGVKIYINAKSSSGSNTNKINLLFFWFIFYNFSVSVSLYCLSIFWKALSNELTPFNPLSKFLCVKLLIFVDFWQNLILNIFNLLGFFDSLKSKIDKNSDLVVCFHNLLLSIELIGFSFGHFFAYSYKSFIVSKIPYSRFTFYHALRDIIGIRDLIHDFKLTFCGNYYKNYRQFDSVEIKYIHPKSDHRLEKIILGLRCNFDGKKKYWISSNHMILLNEKKSNLLPSICNSVPEGLMYDLFYNTNFNFSTSFWEFENHLWIDDDLKVLFEEDEFYYKKAYSIISNCNLDKKKIKKAFNYPVLDNFLDSHAFTYKIKKKRFYKFENKFKKETTLNSKNKIGYGCCT